jgi:hypothetical protein
MLITIIFLTLPFLCFSLVIPPFPARECVKVRVTVQDPSNRYYTNVIISGENTCDKTHDLTGASIAFDSNHPASLSAWGSGQTSDFFILTCHILVQVVSQHLCLQQRTSTTPSVGT